MTLPKIGIISPHAVFSNTAGELAKEKGLVLVIEEYKMQNVDALLHKWQNHGTVEAVVISDTIASYVQQDFSIPVVNVKFTGYDILLAINKAKALGKRIALVALDNAYHYNFKTITKILGLEEQIILCTDNAELAKTLSDMRHQIDAVLGFSQAVVNAAEECDFPAILIQNDRAALSDALEKASQIALIRRRDVRLCRSLQAILSNAYDGIIAMDEEGKIAIFNPVAEKITGLSAAKTLGKSAAEVVEINATCKELFGDGTAISNVILSLNNLHVVVNRLPVALGSSEGGLIVTFQAADKIRQTEAKLRKELHSQGLAARYRFTDIVGRSVMMEETIREARKYARSEAAILITGESGTGKELFAQSVHNESVRREGPFVAINCAALPENLLESELFGYEEGAFTGAKKGGKQGLFTLAHGGTIFLDEIGDLSHSLQARLLRVLQQKEVMPVGGQRVIPVDVRVISATNINLMEAVERGDFRVDLYYRLNVLHLHIPPLRQRMEDLPLLFKHFFQRLKGSNHIKNLDIDDLPLEELKEYLWPGNVRELEGFVERYLALGEEAPKKYVTFKNLLEKLKKIQGDTALYDDRTLVLRLTNLEDMERQIIEQALNLVDGGKGELAKVLGVSRTTLWKKLKGIGKSN